MCPHLNENIAPPVVHLLHSAQEFHGFQHMAKPMLGASCFSTQGGAAQHRDEFDARQIETNLAEDILIAREHRTHQRRVKSVGDVETTGSHVRQLSDGGLDVHDRSRNDRL